MIRSVGCLVMLLCAAPAMAFDFSSLTGRKRQLVTTAVLALCPDPPLEQCLLTLLLFTAPSTRDAQIKAQLGTIRTSLVTSRDSATASATTVQTEAQKQIDAVDAVTAVIP